jgi:amino acid transporter
MAFPFAHFFIKTLELICGLAISESAVVPVAVSGVLVLTVLNCFGLRVGARTQNTLTIIKVAGLVLITIAAFFAPAVNTSPVLSESTLHGFGLAIILVMFTFGGWSDIAYVAAEVHNNVRNIPLIIILTVIVVGVLYLFANAGFFWALGYNGVASSETIAVDALKMVLPRFAQAIVGALIAISALGAINALVFTGARISHAVGLDLLLFRSLAVESKSSGGPLASLLFLGFSSACVIVLMGSFERTVVYTTPVVWFFYFLSSMGLIVLRGKEKFTARPFLVPFYPVLPVCFACACLYIFFSAVDYELLGSLISIGILLLGIPVYKIAAKVTGIKLPHQS